MKIIRHTARDMRQALRAVREQLGEDAVILSSRRTSDGVEVTAAVDFDASTLEAGGFADAPPAAPAPIIDAEVVPTTARPRGAGAPTLTAIVPSRAARTAAPAAPTRTADAWTTPTHAEPAPGIATRDAAALSAAARAVTAPVDTRGAGARSVASRSATNPTMDTRGAAGPSVSSRTATNPTMETRGTAAPEAHEPATASPSIAARVTAALSATARAVTAPVTTRASATAEPTTRAAARSPASGRLSQSALVLTAAFAKNTRPEAATAAAAFQQVADETAEELERIAQPGMTYDQIAASEEQHPAYDSESGQEDEWISEAAREAAIEHAVSPRAPTLKAAPESVIYPSPVSRTELPVFRGDSRDPRAYSQPTRDEPFVTDEPVVAGDESILANVDPVTQAREAALAPFGRPEAAPTTQGSQSPLPHATSADAMGNELKTLRRMLETQLAHLAWNDLTRRAPIHTEMLRELTEIGISQDLAEHLVRQLPDDTDLTFARRFTIAGLSQYLKVTGDRWLDDGGRVAFAGATGVGKTTTLAKIAVRWVLRHGPRDIALVAADSVRIGAQDQLKSLAQLLGVPVYTPEKFDDLPALLSGLGERLVLIDTPGSSVRDPQLGSRLAVLANSASKLETTLVLAASTQAGAIEESVKHFAPANPACCVLTKLDEAASLGGVLSILIRARMPVSYMSEGQRVPEDLRPARALELVSAAVRLAKSRGAAADEDLLRRRFGKTAHGIS